MEIKNKKINGVVCNIDDYIEIFSNKYIISDLYKSFDVIYKDYLSKKDEYNEIGLVKSDEYNNQIFRLSVIITNQILLGRKSVVIYKLFETFDNRDMKSFINIIQYIKRKLKLTVIIISLNTDFLLSNTDNIFLIRNGKVIMEDKPVEVFKNEELLDELKIKIPQIIEIESIIMTKKKKNIGYRNSINDLIKDIYRNI